MPAEALRRREVGWINGKSCAHVRVAFDGVGEKRTGYWFGVRKKTLRRKRQYPSVYANGSPGGALNAVGDTG